MRDPGLTAFALLKLGFTRNAPGQKRLADGGQRYHFDLARRGNDPRLEVAPRITATRHHHLPANIMLKGFSRRCLRNRHDKSIRDVAKKGEPVYGTSWPARMLRRRRLARQAGLAAINFGQPVTSRRKSSAQHCTLGYYVLSPYRFGFDGTNFTVSCTLDASHNQ